MLHIYADLIRKLREHYDFDRNEVADFLGISRIKYVRIENDRSSISLPDFLKLMNFYGVSLSFSVHEILIPRREFLFQTKSFIKNLDDFLLDDMEE